MSKTENVIDNNADILALIYHINHIDDLEKDIYKSTYENILDGQISERKYPEVTLSEKKKELEEDKKDSDTTLETGLDEQKIEDGKKKEQTLTDDTLTPQEKEIIDRIRDDLDDSERQERQETTGTRKSPRKYYPNRQNKSYIPKSKTGIRKKRKLKYTPESKTLAERVIEKEDKEDLEESSSESDYEYDKELDERLKIEEKLYIAKAKLRKTNLQRLFRKESEVEQKDYLQINSLLSSKSINKEELCKLLNLPNFNSIYQIFIVTDYFTKKKDKEYIHTFLLNLKKELSKDSVTLMCKISAYYNKTYPKSILKEDLGKTQENLNLIFSIIYSLHLLNPELLKLIGRFLQ